MDRIESFMELIDYITSSTKRKHIVGGLLLSISFFFAGIATTMMTMRDKEKEEE